MQSCANPCDASRRSRAIELVKVACYQDKTGGTLQSRAVCWNLRHENMLMSQSQKSEFANFQISHEIHLNAITGNILQFTVNTGMLDTLKSWNDLLLQDDASFKSCPQFVDIKLNSDRKASFPLSEAMSHLDGMILAEEQNSVSCS